MVERGTGGGIEATEEGATRQTGYLTPPSPPLQLISNGSVLSLSLSQATEESRLQSTAERELSELRERLAGELEEERAGVRANHEKELAELRQQVVIHPVYVASGSILVPWMVVLVKFVHWITQEREREEKQLKEAQEKALKQLKKELQDKQVTSHSPLLSLGSPWVDFK